MPKINQAGQPSYEGYQGQVTNAVGDQFNIQHEDREDEQPLNAAAQDDGDPTDSAGAALPVDEPVDNEDEPDNQSPSFDEKKSTPAKKAAAPKK